MVVVGTIALTQYVTERRHNYPEISYNQFVRELEQRNIAAIQLTNRRVRGDLRIPVRIGERSSSHFATTLPFESTDSWVSSLVQKGVEVRSEEPTRKRSWPVVVLTLLPYLFILLLVIVMLRHLQGRRRRGES